MADTAQDIIKDALRDLGVVGVGQDLNDDDAARALQRLNDMLDSWSLEPYAIFAHTDVTHTLVVSTASYTIASSGGDITAARPISIVKGFIRDGSNYDHPMNVISFLDYQSIPDKTTESDLPHTLAYNPGHTTGTVYLYPTPSAANTLHMTVHTQLTALSALTTSFSMPIGYRRAVVRNLALELAPMFGESKQAMAGTPLWRSAKDAMAVVKRANNRTKTREAKQDPTLLAMSRNGAGYNINTDGY